MTRATPLWQSIADALRDDLAAGHYGPGDKLPTEAVLAARFGVNRHTVRHALATLAEAGLVRSRRGAGVFVTQTPTDYPIGRRVRFHQNLLAAGRMPAKSVLLLETRGANPAEADALGLPGAAQVHSYEGLSLADGQPMAVFRSVFPAARFADLPMLLAESGSVTQSLAHCGVADYTRISSRLTAKRATATHALHLRLAEGDPILRVVSVSVDPDGAPVEYGHTWFAGDRVTISVLNEDGQSEADAG